MDLRLLRKTVHSITPLNKALYQSRFLRSHAKVWANVTNTKKAPLAFSRSLTTQPKGFSTNPYTESIQKLKTQLKLAVKLTGYTVLSMTAATALIWQSYHWYIEYFLSRSPAALNYKAKLFLHGAYFREHVVPDHELAAIYLEKALEVALEEQKLDEHDSDMIQLRLRLAWNEKHAGHLFDAITQYTRVWALLTSSSPSSSDNTRQQEELIDTAKELGDLYLKVGDTEKAEEFLSWALFTFTQSSSSGSNELTDKYRLLKINLLCSLASLYAIQRNFHLALPLFLQALQMVPDYQQEGQDGSYPWLCMKAILQNQLSEIFYGMGKKDEAMGWAQASLTSSSDGMAKYVEAKDCRECGGVVSNNLGKMLELKGEFDQALNYYRQAQAYASTMDDTSGQIQYETNVIRLEKLLNKDQKDSATSAQDILSAKKEESSRKQTQLEQVSPQGWISWLRGDEKNKTN